MDYTRLDEIINVMFTTAKDVSSTEEETLSDQTTSTSPTVKIDTPSTNLAAINDKREKIIAMMSSNLKTTLLQKSRATYWDASHKTRVACSISKTYPDSIYRYWYAYHPSWDAFLAEGEHSYVVWGGVDLNVAFMMPRAEFVPHLSKMITTTRPDGKEYWHVKILEKSPGTYFLQLPHAEDDLALAPFQTSTLSA